jgi:uncharacterized protein YfcZ (UPF0381/DUF406 family)
MTAEVTIVVSTPPCDQDLDNLKSAAAQLTNRQSSIAVVVTEVGDRFHLTTRFTLKNAAQYKVVTPISEEFEFWTVSLAGYQDQWICFS